MSLSTLYVIIYSCVIVVMIICTGIAWYLWLPLPQSWLDITSNGGSQSISKHKHNTIHFRILSMRSTTMSNSFCAKFKSIFCVSHYIAGFSKCAESGIIISEWLMTSLEIHIIVVLICVYMRYEYHIIVVLMCLYEVWISYYCSSYMHLYEVWISYYCSSYMRLYEVWISYYCSSYMRLYEVWISYYCSSYMRLYEVWISWARYRMWLRATGTCERDFFFHASAHHVMVTRPQLVPLPWCTSFLVRFDETDEKYWRVVINFMKKWVGGIKLHCLQLVCISKM